MNKVNILSFLFNRPTHARETITALLEQKEFINKIYFYLDKPTKDNDYWLQSSVLEIVFELIKKYDLTNYEIISRGENLGIAKSITTATNKYCENNTIPFVVIEDDCKPRPLFLSYMIHAFNKFKNDDDIYTICGYQYHEDKEDSVNIELSKRFNPWGWGSWPHKWHFEWFNGNFKDEYNQKLPPSVRTFTEDKRYLNGKMDIWSTTVIIKQFINDLKTVVPTRSLIENIGFDGTGVHSEVTNVFDVNKNEILDLNLLSLDNKYINFNREEIIEAKLIDDLSKVMNKEI